MTQFKVGDRVQVKSWEEMEREFGADSDGNINLCPGFYLMKNERLICGAIGTIANNRLFTDMYDVELDEPLVKEGQKYNRLYRMYPETLKPAPASKIVIISNGDTTEATYYTCTGRTRRATAKCGPKDKYSFEIGARWAFERLWGKEPVGVKESTLISVPLKLDEEALIRLHDAWETSCKLVANLQVAASLIHKMGGRYE